MRYNIEERVGIYNVADLFTRELKWIFREQPINDYGIDALVEITHYQLDKKGYIASGQLFGVQIKSGKTFFKETQDSHFVFRGRKRHLDYWLNYSLPVLIIIYDSHTKSAYWQKIEENTAILTDKSFKVLIPKGNILQDKSRSKLIQACCYKNSQERKFWKFLKSKDEITLLNQRTLFLYLEISDMPYSDEYYISFLVTDENAKDKWEVKYRIFDGNENRFFHSFLHSPENSLILAINDILPWADIVYGNESINDDKLLKLVIQEVLEYCEDSQIPEIARYKKKNDLFGVACFLGGMWCIKLEVKINNLGYALVTLNSYLQ